MAALVALAASIGVLIVAISVVFGEAQAKIALGAIGASYAFLALALGKSDGSDIAAVLIQRLFSVTRATYIATACCAGAAVLVMLWPTARGSIYGDFAVTVRNEQRLPANDVTLAIIWPDGSKNPIAIDKEGRSTVHYSKLWGARTATLVAISAGQRFETKIRKDERGNFSDQTIMVWSGEKLFRVSYVTVRGKAIDMIEQGELPPNIRKRFPAFAGILKNEIWYETFEMLSAWTVNGVLASGEYAEFKDEPSISDDNVMSSFKWPRSGSLRIDVPGDAQAFSHLFPVDAAGHLRSGALLVEHGGWALSQLTYRKEDDANQASWMEELDAKGDANPDHWPTIYGEVGPGDLDAFSSQGVLTNSEMYEADMLSDEYIRFFKARPAPTGFLYWLTEQFEPGEVCSGPDLAWGLNLVMFMPEPELRVMIIENITAKPVAISRLGYSLSSSAGMIEEGGKFDKRVDTGQDDPISGGVLDPGKALVVPTRLAFSGPYPPIAEQQTQGSPRQVTLRGYVDKYGVSLLERSDLPNETPAPDWRMFNTTFTATRAQIVRRLPQVGSWRRRTFVSRYDLTAPVVTVNGVNIILQPDRHRDLLISSSQEWGGSCDFLIPGSN